MRVHEIIDEYVTIPDPGFVMPDFSNGIIVGKISTGAGQLDVYEIEADNEVGYGAIDPKIGPADALGYLGFDTRGGNVYMAQNALTKSGYEGKGIQSELFLFVNKVVGVKILSDTQLTSDGEKLWNSLIKSGKFDHHIIYVPTMERFDISDIGSKTQDGTIVISPKDDTQNGFYNNDTKAGQRFFYILENKQTFDVIVEGAVHHYGVEIDRHHNRIIQPPRYFYDNEP